jgi:flagellar basal-body rod protein FlgB
MPILDTPMLGVLARYLDVNAFRGAVLTSNLSNVDTPNYKTRDVDFSAEMQRALGGEASMAPVARPVRGLMERPDGNNVSADRESLLLAETQLRFKIGTELLRAEFRRLLSAINEGR